MYRLHKHSALVVHYTEMRCSHTKYMLIEVNKCTSSLTIWWNHLIADHFIWLVFHFRFIKRNHQMNPLYHTQRINATYGIIKMLKINIWSTAYENYRKKWVLQPHQQSDVRIHQLKSQKCMQKTMKTSLTIWQILIRLCVELNCYRTYGVSCAVFTARVYIHSCEYWRVFVSVRHV